MDKTITDLILEKKLIDAATLNTLKKEAEQKGVAIEEYLLEKGKIGEDEIYSLKSKLLKIPLAELAGKPINLEVLKLIPIEAAEHYKFVPLTVDLKKGVLEVGMLNPENIEARQALNFIAHRNNFSPKIFLIALTDFREALKQYSSLRGEVQKALVELEDELKKEKLALKEKPETRERIEQIAEEAPITKVVATILSHALEEGASDIHIEPSEKDLKIRFRVDGILKISLNLPKKIHAAIVSRIKILSNLKIDETRIPQDGRFFTIINDRKIDFRVSTFPTYSGEKVVMRILDPAVGLRSFTDLGLDGRNLMLLKNAITRPYGLILITGPTGSGKTTTLYAILNALNKEDVNIVTLEDPIEYYIDGLNQSQVRPEIGYTFSTGLRHIVRQDPDKIMVGEIRDGETAALAIHAALTGHLVLSTLHTNNSLGVIPRLIDMGVDPYLLPPTLILAIAQRLIGRLCADSKKLMSPSGKLKEVMDKELKEIEQRDPKSLEKLKPFKIFSPEPSKACPEGTKGRVALYEMFEMTSQLEQIIVKDPSEANIEKEAERQGMLTMRQDGLIKSFQGLISFEEVIEETKETASE